MAQQETEIVVKMVQGGNMNKKLLLQLVISVISLNYAYAAISQNLRFNLSQDNVLNSLDGAHGKPGYGFEDGENGQHGKNSNGLGDGGNGGNGGAAEFGKGGDGGNGGDG